MSILRYMDKECRVDNFFYNDPNSIVRLLYRISDLQTATANRLMKRLRLTSEQVYLLLLLNDKDGIPQKDLAEKSSKDQANTTRIIGRLAGKGYIEIRDHVKDRRIKLIYLTADGRDFLDRLLDVINRHSELLYKFHKEEDLENFRKYLLVYVKGLETHSREINALCDSLKLA